MALKINEAILAREYCLHSAEGIEEDDVVNYLAVLERIARIGGVTFEETDFENTVASFLGLPKELVNRGKAIAADEKTSLETLVKRIDDPGFRICLFRDAYRMALADSKLSTMERKALHDIAETLKLTREDANRIADLVEKEVEIICTFSKMVENASKKG